jgi:hypothetical protein
VTWKENEGHYRVIVEPENTFIWLMEKESLRPGMTLEGDVSLDTRHLWEWLTEPLEPERKNVMESLNWTGRKQLPLSGRQSQLNVDWRVWR